MSKSKKTLASKRDTKPPQGDTKISKKVPSHLPGREGVKQEKIRPLKEVIPWITYPSQRNRKNAFVVIPIVPVIPTAHYGAQDDAETPADLTRKIPEHHQDLIALGEKTLQGLGIIEGKKKSFGENVLFLSYIPVDPIVDGDSLIARKLKLDYPQHLLKTYRDNLESNRQLDTITFVIAAHGNPDTIGESLTGVVQDGALRVMALGINPELLASQFDAIFSDFDSNPDKPADALNFFHSKKLVFEFATCNGAYVAIFKDESKETIKERVIRDSYIGKFFRAMCDLGYNVTVSGYRGYFNTIGDKHQSFIVQQSPELSSDHTKAENTKYTISSRSVISPTGIKIWRPHISELPPKYDFALTEIPRILKELWQEETLDQGVGNPSKMSVRHDESSFERKEREVLGPIAMTPENLQHLAPLLPSRKSSTKTESYVTEDDLKKPEAEEVARHLYKKVGVLRAKLKESERGKKSPSGQENLQQGNSKARRGRNDENAPRLMSPTAVRRSKSDLGI